MAVEVPSWELMLIRGTGDSVGDAVKAHVRSAGQRDKGGPLKGVRGEPESSVSTGKTSLVCCSLTAGRMISCRFASINEDENGGR